jgi:MFS family permease
VDFAPVKRNLAVEFVAVKTLSTRNREDMEHSMTTEAEISVNTASKLDKQAVRGSLKASTWDSVFSSMYISITGGVLLSNFLLELGASPMQIGMVSSVPMLVNLLQPVGAYLSERTTSRRLYGMSIFGPARLLWLILVLGIGWNCWHHTDSQILVNLTLAMILFSNLMGALGSASWLSWMATLVPKQLRGRYFGIRSSATNLTNLISVPLLGLVVSTWPGGTIQGYGVLLLFGVVVGLISLACQYKMADVNPQEQGSKRVKEDDVSFAPSFPRLDPNFLRFLLYVGFWGFAVNISAPFFNLYMLDNLNIDVKWVTVYGSLMAGASLLMLLVWGKLADRIGNRPVLILVGVLVALTPFLWLGTGSNSVSVWLWFPLLHLLMGGTNAAIELCNNNLQMVVAPRRNQAKYFAMVAAVAGVGGSLGTTVGGFLAEFAESGGLPAIFALSAVVRLAALLPLIFVAEKRTQSLSQLVRSLLPAKPQFFPVLVTQLASRSQ